MNKRMSPARTSHTRMSPAKYVISIFGGVRKTARAIGRNPAAISRWQIPKSRKGTGGRVPGPAQNLILGVAKRDKLDITAWDLINGRECK